MLAFRHGDVEVTPVNPHAVASLMQRLVVARAHIRHREFASPRSRNRLLEGVHGDLWVHIQQKRYCTASAFPNPALHAEIALNYPHVVASLTTGRQYFSWALQESSDTSQLLVGTDS